MIIKKIYAKNFKSFSEQEIQFENLSILVGANASGKSNTISIFRFISNIITYGLDNAISLSGGIDYVINASIGKNTPMAIKFDLVVLDEKWTRIIDKKEGLRLIIAEINCDFEITPHKRGQGYSITKDILTVTYFQVDKDADEKKYFSDKYYKIIYKNNGTKISFSIDNKTDYKANSELKNGIDAYFMKRFINGQKTNQKELILNKIHYIMPPMFYGNELIRIYDFDSKLMKKSSSLTSIRSLEEDGSNLANVLQSILKNKSSKNLLINLLSDALPFIEQISIENNFDKSISYKIREKYNNKTFYANFLSDGTVNVLALIVALYFEKTPGVIIIEEPERNLHPKLMERIVQMAQETAKEKQVIITTHNPELIKYSDVNTVLFAKRCEKGFTSIQKPLDNKMVNEFLMTEIGMDDLFIQDLLGD